MRVGRLIGKAPAVALILSVIVLVCSPRRRRIESRPAR